jgi:hypothetical protein
MFPPVSRDYIDFRVSVNDHYDHPRHPKYSAEETSLVVETQADRATAFQIPAGAKITIDIPGLHYNREDRPVQQTYLSGLQ